MEGVHFNRESIDPTLLGWKTAAVNASDIGAMGGRPLHALLSIALPRGDETAFLPRFVSGLRRGADAYGMEIAGGDLSSSPTGIVINLAVVGAASKKGVLTRSAARPGECIYVTGGLGAASLGLRALQRHGAAVPADLAPVVRRHRRPLPPVAWGGALAERGLSAAAIDLSDGLSTDLGRLCRASGAGALVKRRRLPLHRSVRRAAKLLGTDPFDAALHGGEDYELLFTVLPRKAAALERLARRRRVRVTAIGEIRPPGEGIRLLLPDGTRPLLLPRGWDHFRSAGH